MRLRLHPSAVPVRHARSTSGALLRVTVWWRRTELDRALAEDGSGVRSEALRLRARQLTGASRRHALAAEIDVILKPVPTGRPPPGSAVAAPVCDVLEARAALRDLAAALRTTTPADPRGMALTSLLLFDSGSPLQGRGQATIQGAARGAAAALRAPWSAWEPSDADG